MTHQLFFGGDGGITGTVAEPTPSPATASGNDETLGGNDVKSAVEDLQNVSTEEQFKKKPDLHSNADGNQQENDKLMKASAADASIREESDILKRESHPVQNSHVQAEAPNGDFFSPAQERKATSVPDPPYTGKSEHIMRHERYYCASTTWGSGETLVFVMRNHLNISNLLQYIFMYIAKCHQIRTR